MGRVLRPHGNAGEMRVAPFNPNLPNLQPGGEVELLGRRHYIERVRWDRGQVLLRLEGLDRRNDIEDARGALLEVPEAEVVREEQAHFVHEIVGLEVVTDDGRRVGRIREVLSTGANDVYVVERTAGEGGGETLIPAIASVVQAIDVAGGVVHITDIGGLLNDPE